MIRGLRSFSKSGDAYAIIPVNKGFGVAKIPGRKGPERLSKATLAVKDPLGLVLTWK